jgi:hypothetical protein
MRSLLSLIFIAIALVACNDDCYDDPQLMIPPTVSNVTLKDFNQGVTYLGTNLFPFGVNIIVSGRNAFYSIVRKDPFSGAPLSFFWSDDIAPGIGPGAIYPFSELQNGEVVTCYVAVFNFKLNYNPSCLFKRAKKIQTSADIIVRTQKGIIVEAKQVEQTEYQVPAQQYAVFSFPLEYKGADHNYSLNLKFDLDGKLVKSDTVQLTNFHMD